MIPYRILTLRALTVMGKFHPAQQVDKGFVTWDDMIHIAPRLVVYIGPGWYSYDGSVYRSGAFYTRSRLRVD